MFSSLRINFFPFIFSATAAFIVEVQSKVLICNIGKWNKGLLILCIISCFFVILRPSEIVIKLLFIAVLRQLALFFDKILYTFIFSLFLFIKTNTNLKIKLPQKQLITNIEILAYLTNL